MTDARVQRYALAGAMAVKISDLLRHVHAAGGGRAVNLSTASGAAASSDDVSLVVRVSRALTVAGACSAVVARLAIMEREAAGAAIGIVDPPQRLEPGVTVLEALPHSTWAATVRAVAAAGAEISAVRPAWERAKGSDEQDVRGDLETLLNYVDRLAALLEVTEPGATGASENLSPGFSR
jgi:hypothetical protein